MRPSNVRAPGGTEPAYSHRRMAVEVARSDRYHRDADTAFSLLDPRKKEFVNQSQNRSIVLKCR
jgi:hypothetical protein